MTTKVGGYRRDIKIILSRGQDFIFDLFLGDADEHGNYPPTEAVFPAGTRIDLRFYPNLAAVAAGEDIAGTATQPAVLEDRVRIRVESPIADLVPEGAEARMTVTFPSSFPGGDNLPWQKCQAGRDD